MLVYRNVYALYMTLFGYYDVSKENENLRNRENLVFMIHYALATFACFSAV